MDYVKQFLSVEGTIGQGAFGQVLLANPLQNCSSINISPVTPRTPATPHRPQTRLTSSNNSLNSIPTTPTSTKITSNKSVDPISPTTPTNQQANSATRFALKCVHPILKPQRLASELRFLRDLGGQNNVVQMHTAHFQSGSLFIVMELIDNTRFVDIVARLTYEEIVIYMKNLLKALEHVHSHNTIHRDIKPANFLYDRKNKKFLLVDFGLAQQVITRAPKRQLPENVLNTNEFNTMLKKLRVSNTPEAKKEPLKLTVGAYESPITHNDSHGGGGGGVRSRYISYTNSNHKRSRGENISGTHHKFSTPTLPRRCDCRGKPKTCGACLSKREPIASKSGTPGFKAPEILLRCPNQTTAIDIWSAGVIFVCLLSGHTPIFRDVDDNQSLCEIMTILGSQRLVQAAQAIGIRLNVEPKREPIDLAQLCRTIRQSNEETKVQFDIPNAAIELLYRMLDPNPLTRITASEALQHAFFHSSNDPSVGSAHVDGANELGSECGPCDVTITCDEGGCIAQQQQQQPQQQLQPQQQAVVGVSQPPAQLNG